ncbi:RND family efflux transporter MFP subunit [Rubrivivax gelatinosus]|uniref:efflux RND transporter periplasmic adaptor subunit n=2 Tax=Rubrivivax gelatinosus TaxID=28068 RepID=UPI0018CB813F|nr:efflux RND transporter periplasmic adaptor subunit [Rubrivivax gelatinosus]MBG6082879.1 RND family efflux transporter MFP subunit [Rubrivivax gelatinosus]
MPSAMPSCSKLLVPSCLAAAVAAAAFLAFAARAADEPKAAPAPKAALTVTVTQPQIERLPIRIAANGNVAAWQEASVGTEANGLRLAEVRANVGDVVKRGQVLAVFAPDTVQADLAQIDAGVAEAEAALAEAAADAERARELQPSGALSAQQVSQYLTAERTAQARLQAQRAAARVQRLRLAQTQVLAPDAGVISARSATVGAVLPAGQELFRLIRQGRLEWRAELPSSDLARVKPGMRARVLPINDGAAVAGTVRVVAPTVDAQTRNGIVYVDLGPSADTRAGMFARGEFEVGSSEALTLPQSAVVLRDGFHYVLKLGADSRVALTKVAVGRRAGERIEITGGLDAAAKVVAAGSGFLGDGDTVRVVSAPRSAAATAGN